MLSKYYEWQRSSLEVRGQGEHGIGGVCEDWLGGEGREGGAGSWEGGEVGYLDTWRI